MKNRLFFLIFLTGVTVAMERARTTQTVLTTPVASLRIHQHADYVQQDSRSCCSLLGNLIINAPAAVCLLSADYAVAHYIKTLEYLGNQIRPYDKLKAE